MPRRAGRPRLTGLQVPLAQDPALLAGLTALRSQLRAVLRSGWAAPHLEWGPVPVVVGGGGVQLTLATASPRRPRPELPRPAPPPSPASDDRSGSAEIVDAVQRAQDGDAEAFGELYDHYVDLVYRYVAFRVGNVALAEDLTSEAFVRALRRITSFSWQGRDFGAWLITIARNLIADHFKSGRYRMEFATSDLLDAGADRSQEGPEREVLDALTNVELLRAVKLLGPEQQECLVLRFLQGLSVAETAQIMGKNDGAIKALQYRAVRSLARLLPEGFTP